MQEFVISLTDARQSSNPVIHIWREQYDESDPWGSNISFMFALCDYITFELHATPALDFRASPFGPDSDNPAYQYLQGLNPTLADCEAALERFVAFDGLCRKNGLDY